MRIKFILAMAAAMLFNPHASGADVPGVAVVELYTSEGCSSCPPADRVLNRLVEQSKGKDARIFPLAFHVDYFNDADWADPFSSAANSDRQRNYARLMHADNVYTPQEIVNGRAVVAAYDAKQVAAAVQKELAAPAAVGVTIALQKESRPDVRPRVLTYELSAVPANVVLCVAVVERGLTSLPSGGENGGKRLVHENVVRWFKTFEIAKSGKATLTVVPPTDVHEDKAGVIVFVQKRDGPIVGAAGCGLAE